MKELEWALVAPDGSVDCRRIKMPHIGINSVEEWLDLPHYWEHSKATRKEYKDHILYYREIEI